MLRQDTGTTSQTSGQSCYYQPLRLLRRVGSLPCRGGWLCHPGQHPLRPRLAPISHSQAPSSLHVFSPRVKEGMTFQVSGKIMWFLASRNQLSPPHTSLIPHSQMMLVLFFFLDSPLRAFHSDASLSLSCLPRQHPLLAHPLEPPLHSCTLLLVVSPSYEPSRPRAT